MTSKNTSNEEKQLDVLLESIFASVKRHSNPDNIDKSLCENLRHIRDHSLYTAAKDEEGQPLFSDFDKFVAWAAKEARRRLREEGEGKSIQTGYKLINESVLFNRLEGIVKGPLPTHRAQLQVLEKCPQEKQIAVWESAVTQAGSKRISRAMLTKVAQGFGAEIIDPPPSASSILGQVRGGWHKLRSCIEPNVTDNYLLVFRELDLLLGQERRAIGESSKLDDSKGDTPHSSGTVKCLSILKANPVNKILGLVQAGGVQTSTPSAIPPSEPVSSNSAEANIKNLSRPFATRLNGGVVVGFASPGEYLAFKTAGFPNLKPRKYNYKGDLCDGVWLREDIAEKDLAEEILELEKLLKMTASKISRTAA